MSTSDPRDSNSNPDLNDSKILNARISLLEKKLEDESGMEKKNFFSPVILAICGGIVTLLVSIGTKFWENKLSIEADNRRFQIALLEKISGNTVESKEPDGALYSLNLIQGAGIIDTSIVNWNQVRIIVLSRTEKNRLDSVYKVRIVNVTKGNNKPDTINVQGKYEKGNIASIESGNYIIVAGGDATLESAQYEMNRAVAMKFPDVRIVYRNGSYRTCIGNYKAYSDAIVGLLAAKDKLNQTAYLVRSGNWCPNPVLNSKGYFECK